MSLPMPVTRKTHQLRREPEPASLTLEHLSAPYEFPSEWWTFCTRRSLTPSSPGEPEERRAVPRHRTFTVTDNVINFNNAPDIGFQFGPGFEL